MDNFLFNSDYRPVVYLGHILVVLLLFFFSSTEALFVKYFYKLRSVYFRFKFSIVFGSLLLKSLFDLLISKKYLGPYGLESDRF